MQLFILIVPPPMRTLCLLLRLIFVFPFYCHAQLHRDTKLLSLHLIAHDSLTIACDFDACRLRITPVEHGEDVESFLASNQDADAAINGTFYDWDSKGDYVPVGLVINEGSLLWQSVVDITSGRDSRRVEFAAKATREQEWYATFSVDVAGHPFIDAASSFYRAHAPTHFHDITCAVEAGPLLLHNGVVCDSQCFGHVGCGAALPRSAIGITAMDRVVLFCSRAPLTCHQLAVRLREMGVIHAIYLDGGPSSAMSVKNAYLAIRGSMPVGTILWIHN